MTAVCSPQYDICKPEHENEHPVMKWRPHTGEIWLLQAKQRRNPLGQERSQRSYPQVHLQEQEFVLSAAVVISYISR